jgi:uncharacterized membrane protein
MTLFGIKSEDQRMKRKMVRKFVSKIQLLLCYNNIVPNSQQAIKKHFQDTDNKQHHMELFLIFPQHSY